MDASSITLQWPITPQIIQSGSRSGPSRPPSPPPISSRSSSLTPLTDEEPWSPTKDKGKKRKRGEDEDEDRPPAKDKRKKRRQDNGDDNNDTDNDDDEDGAFQDQYDDVSAQSLVQQVMYSTASQNNADLSKAWAQAVRVDGSVIVLHSGNHELVCIRHRTTQTLYVSDLIGPHKCVNPGYGKLQVGV
jgi:hypothetical protein